MDDLRAEIQRLILANCFSREESDQVEGADFAAEDIVKLFQREAPANPQAPTVTLDMLDAGMTAYQDFDPERDEPYALVWAIISRAEAVRLARSQSTPDIAMRG